jgi:hypothetical protein
MPPEISAHLSAGTSASFGLTLWCSQKLYRGGFSCARIFRRSQSLNMGPRTASVLAVLLLAGLTFGCGGGLSSNGGPVTTPAAPTAPAAPTVLTATPGNQQVNLTWMASSGATSYHVKRATTSGGPYTEVGSATVTSYSDAGLTNGTKYFYVVSALNTAGESANSSEASGTPTSSAPAQAPSVP